MMRHWSCSALRVLKTPAIARVPCTYEKNGRGCSQAGKTTLTPTLSPRERGVTSDSLAEQAIRRRLFAGGASFHAAERSYFAFVLLLSIIGAHFPSGVCMSILKVYSVGDTSLMTTRDFIFWPPIMLSS